MTVSSSLSHVGVNERGSFRRSGSFCECVSTCCGVDGGLYTGAEILLTGTEAPPLSRGAGFAGIPLQRVEKSRMVIFKLVHEVSVGLDDLQEGVPQP